MAVYISRLDVMGRCHCCIITFLGLMSWVGAIVAVYISRLDVMGRYNCGCLHFKARCHR